MRKESSQSSMVVTGCFRSAVLISIGIISWMGVVASTTAQDIEIDDCADCHEETVTSVRRGPHSALDRDLGIAEHHGVASSCGGCHGDPGGHLESGDTDALFTFDDDTTANERSAQCLSCHASDQPRFHATSHAQIGLDCTSCHSIHAGTGPNLLELEPSATLLDLDASSATCASCHAPTVTAFEFNERHRLKEGILGCNDCHDPHAPTQRRMLGGFKQQQCAQCHVDKAGPFVFEHGSVMVDGCVACHEPHGGPNRHQLKFQKVAELCYSCHIMVPGFHRRFTNETVCTNCHSSIHGSNFHSAFLK